MYGHSEIDLKFPTPIPVNITYQTAFVDDAGKLQLRKDVYGRDATMLSLLKNARSKDLENMVAHSQPNYCGVRRARACRLASASPATTASLRARRSSSGCSAVRRRRPRSVAQRAAAAAAGVHPLISARPAVSLNILMKSTISPARRDRLR